MEWQDIKTAPRDGDDFLAYDADVGMYAARYLRWLNRFGFAWNEAPIRATHWMPLPAPPVHAQR